MRFNKNTFALIAGLALFNAAGFLLRYLELDNFVIVLGFRFHLSIFLPFLIFLRKDNIHLVKEVFTRPQYKKLTIFFTGILLPSVLLILLMFVSEIIKTEDPEYFYEFGLSSIADFPVYLIWNSLQLFMFFIFLGFIIRNEKAVFIKAFFLILILFTYEFIPLDGSVNYLTIISFVLIISICSLLFTNFRNIYLFALSVFTIPWFHFLAFGTDSEMIINLLFASQYTSWEGFFKIQNEISDFIMIIHFGIILIFLLIASFAKKND